PAAFELSGNHLAKLQRHQEATVRDRSSNLPLEPVDFSTRQGIAVNVPRRMGDVLLRPFPWQLGDTNQRLGMIGSLVALALLAWMLSEIVRGWRSVMSRAGPLVYTGFFLLLAYAVSAANAGTAFRYRSELLGLVIGIAVTLWSFRTAERPALVRRLFRRPQLAVES